MKIEIVRNYLNLAVKRNVELETNVHFVNGNKFNIYKVKEENGEISKQGNYTNLDEELKEIQVENYLDYVLVDGKEIKLSGYVLNRRMNCDVFITLKYEYVNNFIKFCKELNKKYEFCDYIKEYKNKMPFAFN